VAVISARTGKVTATIHVGSQPDAVAINPATGAVYVPNSGSNTVSVI
jgi:DNA-binding beta-propeller fold protein YncE